MTCCNSSRTPSFPPPRNLPHLPFPLPPASPRRARPLLSRTPSTLVACPTFPPISLSPLLSPLSRPSSTQSAPSPSSSSPPLLFPPSSPFPPPLSSSHLLTSFPHSPSASYLSPPLLSSISAHLSTLSSTPTSPSLPCNPPLHPPPPLLSPSFPSPSRSLSASLLSPSAAAGC
ncbi:unnamed protein product [Closterium sp. Naga37s-1]|nr:unnamed protein product [Closterium sp. Naga37s-1]